MQYTFLGARTGLRVAGVLAVATLAAACGDKATEPVPDPNLPADPAPTPRFQQAAFILDVNLKTRQVKVTAPEAGLAALRASGSEPTSQDSLITRGDRPISKGLQGGDVVTITPSNFFASGVGTGGAPAGRVLVRFDLTLTNRLQGVQLVRPGGNSLQAFPTPPNTTDNLYAFPFRNVVTTTTGGVTGSENEVIIELPNRGNVEPSPDWDGAPWNWFNDTDCAAAGANDCFRYEPFPAPLGPLASSGASTVGFIIDPTVSNFRTFILVAADLQNSGPAVTATVRTRLSSPQRGIISGAVGTITPGGFSGTSTTDAAPAFNLTIGGVTAGPARTLAFTFPAGTSGAGCTAPSVSVPAISASGNVDLPDVTVTCPAATGTVSGSIGVTLAGGLATAPSLAGATVTITPAGAFAPITLNPSAAGAFSSSAVPYDLPSGSGTVSVTGIPAGCTPSSFTGATAATYAGLTTATPQTVSFAVTCSPPPSFYQLYVTWGPVTGGSITATWELDMSTRNDPTDPGADLVTALQFNTSYAPAAARFAGFDPTVACTGAGGWTIATAGPGTGLANNVTWGVVSTAGRTNATGTRIAIGSCTFPITGTGPTTAPLTMTVASGSYRPGAGLPTTDIVPFVNVNNASTTIP